MYNNQSKRLVLGEGETIGHKHVLESSQEISYEKSDDNIRLFLSGMGILTHDEHDRMLTLMIIVGALSLNVCSLCLIIYNGFNFGHSFALYKATYSYKASLCFTLPHGILESIWIIWGGLIALFLSIDVFHVFAKSETHIDIREIWRKYNRKLVYCYALVLLSAVVEVFFNTRSIFVF